MKLRERELTIEDAVSEACGELSSLAEEMRDAFDNTPESLQSSGVGEARGEAADALENISEPDLPEELAGDKFKVKWSVRQLTPKQQMKQSRSARRDDAVATLGAVVNVLEEIKDDEQQSEDMIDIAASYISDLEGVIGEAEDVNFPGMYG